MPLAWHTNLLFSLFSFKNLCVLCVSAVRFYNSAKLRAMLAALNRSLRKAEVSNRA